MGGGGVTFERPDLIGWAALGVLIVVVALWAQWRRSVRFADAFGGREPATRLLGRDPTRPPALRALVALAGVAALALIGAGLQPAEPAPAEPAAPIDLIIAVDVSHSMSAADITPSRAGQAQTIVERLAEEQAADRMALTLFADWPFALVPLTDDPDVVDFFAPWVAPELLAGRDQGTSLANLFGFVRSVWSERSRDGSNPIVLVLSDGEAHGDDAAVLDSARALAEDGIQVWTAGIGTSAGAPLFVAGSDEAPFLDGEGQPVVAAFEPELLRRAASETDGRYFDATDDGGVRSLVNALRREAGTEESLAAQTADPLFWLLLIALLSAVADAVLDTGRRRRPPLGGSA